MTRGQDILVTLCQRMETEAPADAAAVYALTHAATEAFNTLAEAFEEAESEIETAARDNIAVDVEAILTAYGHALDLEEALAPRDW